MVAGWVSLALVSLLVHLARPTPVDYFPLNSQLPPVARIGEPFSFIFSPLTFSSPFPTSYSLVGAPQWLSIDSSARRLYGTPSDDQVPPGEVVGITIALVAQDSQGNATSNATLVVSRNPPPTINIPVENQISKFGNYSTPASLLLNPSKSFSFAFDSNTVSSSAAPQLNYYAVSGDGTPLPSWIQFDAANLTFSGETPSFESLVQPPQAFPVQLVASDVTGFAAVSIPFSIVVGNHELTSEDPVIAVNATRGVAFQYNDLPRMLELDEKTPSPADIQSITAYSLPTWLSFDNKTWSFTGTPDLAANSSNVTVAIQDKYLDSLNVTLEVEMVSGIFRSNLPTLNATGGENVSFDMKPYLLNPADVDLSVEDSSKLSWLHYDASTMVFSGTAPDGASADDQVALKATSKSTKETDSRYLEVHMIPSSTRSPSKSASSTSATSTASSIAAPVSSKSSSNKNLLWLILPLLLLCAGIVLLFVWLRRRRRGRRDSFPEVSAPVPGSFARRGPDSLEESALHDTFDVGPLSANPTGLRSVYAPMVPSNQRSSWRSSDPSLQNGREHKITLHSGVLRSFSDRPILETQESWLAGQKTAPRRPPRPEESAGSDGYSEERSLLSDTSLGEGDYPLPRATPVLVTTKARTEKTPIFDLPVIPEPSSIQNTPLIAYGSASSLGSEKDDDTFPTATGFLSTFGQDTRQASGQKSEATGLRALGRKVSSAWKRGSSDRLLGSKRSSNLSTSTGQTIRTSILSDGASERPATANIISRPTIIHIPSKPGEVRQISRRADHSSPLFAGGSFSKSPSRRNFSRGIPEASSSSSEEVVKVHPIMSRPRGTGRTNRTADGSSPLFGGGSLAKSPRNFSKAMNSPSLSGSSSESSKPPSATMRSPLNHTLDGDAAWDKLARNSLGIAYKDVVTPGESLKSSTASKKAQDTIPASPEPRLSNDRLSRDLMSPSKWPRPSMSGGLGTSLSNPDAPAPLSLPKSTTPATPQSRGIDQAPSSKITPLSINKQTDPSPQDQRLRLSQLREQEALKGFKAMLASKNQTPDQWPAPPPPPRPLPETPSRTPLTGLGTRSNVSRKSNRTIRSAKSIRSENAEDDEWEDLRPESTTTTPGLGYDDGEESFAVYI